MVVAHDSIGGFSFRSRCMPHSLLGAAGARTDFSAAGFTTLDGRNTGDSSGFSVGIMAGF